VFLSQLAFLAHLLPGFDVSAKRLLGAAPLIHAVVGLAGRRQFGLGESDAPRILAFGNEALHRRCGSVFDRGRSDRYQLAVKWKTGQQGRHGTQRDRSINQGSGCDRL
jgi:hypothetical protein